MSKFGPTTTPASFASLSTAALAAQGYLPVETILEGMTHSLDLKVLALQRSTRRHRAKKSVSIQRSTTLRK
jgi:hypothetical protein